MHGCPVLVHLAGAVVVVALVVLHADEVVVPRQVQPHAIHLGALAVPDRRVVARHLVVDDGQAEAHRQPGPPGLDGLPRRPVPGRHPVRDGVHLLPEHQVGGPVPRYPRRLARGSQGGPLQVARCGGDVEPAQQPGEVRLVERDGPGRAVTEVLGDDAAVPAEQPRSLRVEPPAALGEPVRRGEMVVGDHRRDPGRDTVIHDRAVVRQGLRRELALGRLDPGPLDGEPVGVQAEPGHQVDVLAPQLVAVAGPAGRLTERRRVHVLQEPGIAARVAALGLVARGGHSPAETRRERPWHPARLTPRPFG